MLRSIEVNQVRQELLCVWIISVRNIRVNSLNLNLALFAGSALFRSSCSRCGFLFLMFALLLFFFKAALLLFIDFLLFNFFFAFILHHLRKLLKSCEVRAEPILDSDLDLCALEAPQDFLIAKHVTFRKGVLNVGEKRMVLG